jgi:hypothetical protein
MEQTTSHFRTLHYVEVIYLRNGQYTGKKFVHYPVDEAKTMYARTINKFKEDSTKALVCLREENHQLIKSEMI